MEEFDDDIGSSQSQSSTDDIKLSALRDNIAKKGKNAYYYAHGFKADGPDWDGNEQPRLLSTSGKDSISLKSGQLSVNRISEYAWIDGKAHVKVYIEYSDLDTVKDEDIELVSLYSLYNIKLTNNICKLDLNC